MALSVLQSTVKTGNGVTSITTDAITTTAGSLLVASYAHGNGRSFFSLTDSKSNTWSESIPLINWGEHGYQRYVANCLGGGSHTFTLTITPAGTCALTVLEIAGAASAPFDKYASGGHSGSGPHTSGLTATTTQADEILVGFGATEVFPATPSATGGWTTYVLLSSTETNDLLIAGYRIVSATGTYEYTWNSSSVDAITGIATFKASSLTPVQITPPTMRRL